MSFANSSFALDSFSNFNPNSFFNPSFGGHSDEPRELQPDEIHSDCDSEGAPPPTDGEFVDPLSVENRLVAPPRGEAVALPFYEPKERVRFRQHYESRVSYEAWVDATPGQGPGLGTGPGRVAQRREVKKLEEDSEFPVGRAYFWGAFCRTCNRSYAPHVPPMWQCMRCKNKTWQHPEDPSSRHCAVCQRGVEKMRKVGGVRLRNPMANNAHMCKRCGRAVCDSCYAPVAMRLDEWGYTEPQRVCVHCIDDAESVRCVPEEEDLGTLHDEGVAALEEVRDTEPFWPPRCSNCNIAFAHPPPRWACTSCGHQVWQPLEATDSATCWICDAAFPKCRCHRCGQLVCPGCGAFGQPLPELGFDDGAMRSVCKVCYGGVAVAVAAGGSAGAGDMLSGRGGRAAELPSLKELAPQPWPGACPGCHQASSPGAPDQWTSRCHKRRTWQPEDHPKSSACAVCAMPIAEGGREHCHQCGRLVCIPCAQYRQPLPERGFPKGIGQPVCRLCFHPKSALLPSYGDGDTWPPKCNRCGKSWAHPPERWRCTAQCGNVWQPVEHVASRSCAACGKRVVRGHVNCRRCGRVVCAGCGAGRAAVLERGFTRGVEFPVCPPCLKQLKPPGGGGGGPSSGAAAAAAGGNGAGAK